jgi:Protein of unknown function (DUF3089)
MADPRSTRRPITAGLALVGALTALVLAIGATATVTAASAKTIWLCKPGVKPDPCTPGLSATDYSPTLSPLRVTRPKSAKRPLFDCFYVYPTVSDQTTTLSNRQVDPEQRSIALYQAARYSQSCRLFAPMYRQVTVPALDSGTTETPAQLSTPLGDVTAAFKLYLRKYNDGRPFVLIGHSQGSFVLEQMIRKVIDRNRSLRARMLSAILLGGNVLVKDGSDVGGTFKHVPACRTINELGCVIAFSSFDQPAPPNSLFGRTTVPGEHVLCVNPVALQGRSRVVDPILPSAPFAPGTLIAAGIQLLGITQPQPPTVWSSLPGSYSARCSGSDGAHVLQVTALPGAQVPTPSPDPTWGLHLLDANIELGNLTSVVDVEAHHWWKAEIGQ